MSWNNRIVRHKDDRGEWYAIHETFYNKSGAIWAITKEPITISGETVDDVLHALATIWTDVKKHKDVLDFDMEFAKPEIGGA